MPVAKLYNLARMTTSTTGTGTITLGSAVSGYLSFATAGATDGDTLTYAIKDGTNSEIGRGVYTSSGTTLTRGTILKSTNGGSAISLSGSAEVFITASAEDFLQLDTGGFVPSIELGHATDTTLTRSAAGEVAVEGTLFKKVGKETIWMPAGSMIPRTTNGASWGTVETSTNRIMFRTLNFDATTQEFSQFNVRMPKGWNLGTVTASFTWSHAATTTNFGAVWALEAVATSDGDAGDAAFGTAQQVAKTGGTTNTIYTTAETPAITIAGTPAAQDLVTFQVKRVPADASDTMAIDARLHGVTVYFTTNASTDA